MADYVSYQHFKSFAEAYELAHSEKNENTSQTAVGKVWKKMKADFPVANKSLPTISQESETIVRLKL